MGSYAEFLWNSASRYERNLWIYGPSRLLHSIMAETSNQRKIQSAFLEVDTVQRNILLGSFHISVPQNLHTALGQNIYTTQNQPNGHYNHLDLLNRVRYHGSIAKFIEEEKIDNGIIYSLEKNHIPYVLGGSIRDDGPLPPVFADVYKAQDAMRNQVRDATTVICMATMLHTIATGNMTPSFRVMPDGTVRQIYFYCVDIAEFVVNKLADRGSLSAKGIVTNVQDFVVNLSKGLGL